MRCQLGVNCDIYIYIYIYKNIKSVCPPRPAFLQHSDDLVKVLHDSCSKVSSS